MFRDDNDNAMSCGDIHRLLNAHKFFQIVYAPCVHDCLYKKEKATFLESHDSVTNYSYFFAESSYAHQIEQRHLLICDEAHTIENALSAFVEIVVTERFARQQLNMKNIPKSNATMDEVFAWLRKQYHRALSKKLNECKKYMEENETQEKLVTLTSYVKQYELLDKHICKLNRFIEAFDHSNWTMTPEMKNDQVRFVFKPVDVSGFSHEKLFNFGRHTLMMSATILDCDVFCETLGISKDEVAFIRIPSPFPIENRPVHYMPVGSMSKACIESSLPKMAEVVQMILDEHPKDKGVIHCTSFRVANYIRDNVQSVRLLTHDSTNRDQVLQRHFVDPAPTVLVSPSMMEGVDLKDDRSRFQIICKLPFPYLGDEVVKKRMQKNPQWYACSTVRSIVQALGRSIRNENDHAVSYILDSDWERFMQRNKKMLPEDIVRSIV
jgi:Rad3-related DNA helicase